MYTYVFINTGVHGAWPRGELTKVQGLEIYSATWGWKSAECWASLITLRQSRMMANQASMHIYIYTWDLLGM